MGAEVWLLLAALVLVVILLVGLAQRLLSTKEEKDQDRKFSRRSISGVD